MPRRWHIFWWTFAGLILAGFVMVMDAFESINDETDRCVDPSSGRYITDPIKRAQVCKRPELADSRRE